MEKAIYLLDLTHESKLGLGSDMMPLQVGLIGAHCLKDHGERVRVELFKFIADLEKAVRETPPFIVGVSNYMWNINLGYKAAGLIKKERPETILVFGGPNFPDTFDEQVGFLKKYPDIDFYINKDGEVPFSRLAGFLLENPDLTAAKQARLPSCCSLVEGIPYFGEVDARLMDLSATPSPYTTGLMDKFFEHKLLPTLQTNRGCPFTCTFCTEGSKYYNKIGRLSLERKKADIEYIVARNKHTKTLRITDSNFGMFAEDVEFCQYLSEVQKRTGFPEYVASSTGKNQKERILKCNELLGGIMRFTASVQSLNPQVLKNIKRDNISLDQIISLSDRISDTETHSYSEIILGLPGDSLETEKESIEGLTRAGISNVTQHQMALIYGTEMGTAQCRQEYQMKTKFRPVQRCIGLYSMNEETFTAVEIEEICVANSTMSYEDYLEARRLYLTVGFFYNDRIFGEIHALLRFLQLSTWQWLLLIHEDVKTNEKTARIRGLYDGFLNETRAELWETPQDLTRDVSKDIDQYASGEIGGNLIYKYRSQAITENFEELQQTAYRNLRAYLAKSGVVCEDLVRELEIFSQYQKANLFDFELTRMETFTYDIIKLIKDPSLAREKKELKDIRCPTTIRFAHTDQQKETIGRQLDFYGRSIGGLTMLLARFPIKRFYRTAEKILNPSYV